MEYPIPSKLNIFIIAVCSAAIFSLFIAATLVHSVLIKILLGFAFAVVMIPVYSLMHEAAHNTLHPNPIVNTNLARWLCCMFIISFSFYRHCHLKHHKKNRTDDEMWDLYYEQQNKFLRYGNLYLMMIGFGYLATWLSVLLFAISPRLVTSSIFKKHTEINGFLHGFDTADKLSMAQAESIIVIIFQLLLLWIIHWNWQVWIIFYLAHGFVWSSQNYVNHAFSPRDIINGAHNLSIARWLNLIYLNFNIHLAHHQHPNIPWLHLPSFIKSGKGKLSFYRNYIRLWKGPQLIKKKPPEETA